MQVMGLPWSLGSIRSIRTGWEGWIPQTESRAGANSRMMLGDPNQHMSSARSIQRKASSGKSWSGVGWRGRGTCYSGTPGLSWRVLVAVSYLRITRAERPESRCGSEPLRAPCQGCLVSGTLPGPGEADVGLQARTRLLPQLSAHSRDGVRVGSLSLALSPPPEEVLFLPTVSAPLPRSRVLQAKSLAGCREELEAPDSAR